MKVMDEFQRMFDEFVLPYTLREMSDDGVLDPLRYILNLKSNKFRSATSLISAKISGGDYDEILPIAAVSELIHSSIIIQDDIADKDELRRGHESAWKKYGVCFALHSSLYVIPFCIRQLEKLNSPQAGLIKENFLRSYELVCWAQSAQARLDIFENGEGGNLVDYFTDIHYGKTVLGHWAVISPALFYGNRHRASLLEKYAKLLGDAGSLKNDLEDFMLCNEYEPWLSDVREGRATYPLYHFYSQCDAGEKKEFREIFGSKNIPAEYPLKEKIFHKGTITHCIERIQRLVEQSLVLLEEIPCSFEKDLLEAWAVYHTVC